jgi:hypothetical protein
MDFYIETDMEHIHDDGSRHGMEEASEIESSFPTEGALTGSLERICSDCGTRVALDVTFTMKGGYVGPPDA